MLNVKIYLRKYISPTQVVIPALLPEQHALQFVEESGEVVMGAKVVLGAPLRCGLL